MLALSEIGEAIVPNSHFAPRYGGMRGKQICANLHPMKRFYVFLLLFLIPLQGAIAAVGVYHNHDSQESKSAFSMELAFVHEGHSHGHDAYHSHESHPEQSTSGDDTDEHAGHHHHCHASSCTFIDGHNTIQFANFSDIPPQAVARLKPANLADPIYRPNWQ